MMLPTHAIAGLAIATPLLVLAPDHAAVALAGGLVGGVLPDLDLYSGHRRTLHYPSGYTLAALPTAGFAAILQTPLLVALTFVLLGAALHCRMDRYGGGLELRPWEARPNAPCTTTSAGNGGRPSDGYSTTVHRRMWADGTRGFAAVRRSRRAVPVGRRRGLVTGATYSLLRRRLATLAPVVFGNVPESISAHVPDRYRQ